MSIPGFSDQYIVLDSFKAAQESDLANGELIFNLAIQGFTTETVLGVHERLNRICEIEVEEFQFPADIPYIQTAPRYRIAPVLRSKVSVDDPGIEVGVPTMVDGGGNSTVYDQFNSELNGFSFTPSIEINQYSPEFRRFLASFSNGGVTVLPTLTNNPSITAISPIQDIVTMYIKETGLQSISDLKGSRHNFNFKVSTIENTTIYKCTRRSVDDREVIDKNSYLIIYSSNEDVLITTPLPAGTELDRIEYKIFNVVDTPHQYSISSYTLKPTKSIYVFTDPIIDISKFTIIFKNPDNFIAMYPSVYLNVPAVFMLSGDLTNLTGFISFTANDSIILHLCFIIKDHNLLPGDIVIVNDITMIVYGSFKANAFGAASAYPSQLAKDVIFVQPLIYKFILIADVINFDTFVTIKIPKRRIRIPLRLRRVVDRKTNSIISTS
jgi:hypothetical protein